MEMYARKVVLLQVLKYMPKSVEVQRAVDVATALPTPARASRSTATWW
jgi:recombination protein RecT